MADEAKRPSVMATRGHDAFSAFARTLRFASQASPTRSQPEPAMGLIAAAEGIEPI